MKHENTYSLISRFNSLAWYVVVKRWTKVALTPEHFFLGSDLPLD